MKVGRQCGGSAAELLSCNAGYCNSYVRFCNHSGPLFIGAANFQPNRSC